MLARSLVHAVVILGIAATQAQAQAVKASSVLSGDLLKATSEVEEKLVGLANALSPAQYDWRPGEGVRSVKEVLLHVAADNYFMPAAMGVPAPAATKITTTDFAALTAFEKQSLDKAATIAALRASFAHLRKAMAEVPESQMDQNLKVFGQDYTKRAFLILATTHLHEHLGQMIAYTRSNGVKPPWSR